MFEGLLQPMHLLVIFVVVLLVFGPKNLPAIGKGLGESIREFKKAINGEDKDSVSRSEISKKDDERKTTD
ncbi:twin-arginine translocase TatA/TatE family subunit [bacterium]|nr:MAG: twin-arginine translocase TatA/TatE family subunit [bacterium]